FLDREIDLKEQNELSAFDIARLMVEFNVSFDMALNRLENLGQIDSAERIRLDNQRNQTRVGNLLRSVGGNSRLNEPSETISIPFEYINYVIFNYNSGAIPKETLEKALECYQLSIDDISDKLVQQEDIDDDTIDFDTFIGRQK
ncbi:MAG: ImmA/IrrE family metallo-endopeptidase, partial [Lachnospiraceae bacterium]|nr:ImmA/IrrE family metallo-endopeptidase [Lachnospiraceae bacterium]